MDTDRCPLVHVHMPLAVEHFHDWDSGIRADIAPVAVEVHSMTLFRSVSLSVIAVFRFERDPAMKIHQELLLHLHQGTRDQECDLWQEEASVFHCFRLHLFLLRTACS
jgi:hypothetical protein